MNETSVSLLAPHSSVVSDINLESFVLSDDKQMCERSGDWFCRSKDDEKNLNIPPAPLTSSHGIASCAALTVALLVIVTFRLFVVGSPPCVFFDLNESLNNIS